MDPLERVHPPMVAARPTKICHGSICAVAWMCEPTRVASTEGKKASKDECARAVCKLAFMPVCFYFADFVTFSSPDSSERGRFGFARVVHVLNYTDTHAITNCPYLPGTMVH